MAHRFPVYALDFQAVESGKVVASSKRRVRWRFGFTNQQALAAGRTGVECRGEEHDIVLIWSVTSGKRQLYMDGQEVHFSTNRSSVFQYSWAARGNHIIKVVAHAAAPSYGAPYELYIDGQPFSAMPKAYEIGISGPPSHARGPSSRGYPSNSGGSSMTAQEEEELQRAIRASLQETKRTPPAPAPAPQPTADLLNFAAPPQPPVPYVATPSYASPPPGYAAQPPSYVATSTNYAVTPTSYTATPQYASPVPPAGAPQASPGYASSNALQIVPASGPSYASQSSYSLPSAYDSPSGKFTQGSPPPSFPSVQPQPTAQQPTSVVNGYALAGAVRTGDLFASLPVDPFTPVAQPPGDFYGFNQPDDPFAPRPPPPPTRADINNSILNAYAAPPAQPNQQYLPSQGGPAPMPGNQAVFNGGQMSHANAIEEESLSELEKAMKKLVNIERIDEPAEQDYLLSMKKKEEEQKKAKDGKSRGKPPAAVGLVGSNATLDHIKAVKPETAKTSEGVMRAPPQLFHPDAVHAGALVVHGQGPPPIQRGFGIGYGVPPPNYQQQRW